MQAAASDTKTNNRRDSDDMKTIIAASSNAHKIKEIQDVYKRQLLVRRVPWDHFAQVILRNAVLLSLLVDLEKKCSFM